MPNIADHFGIINTDEKMLPHGIGLKNEVSGLFLKYSNKLTSYMLNNNMRWEITDNVLDFAIDRKASLLFYTISNTVKCVSLKSGAFISSFTLSGVSKIACSPKHKYIYVVVNNSTLACYDYQFNLVASVNMSVAQHKPVVLDKYDLVISHTRGSANSNTNKRRKLSHELGIISTITNSVEVYPPVAYREQDGRIFWHGGQYIQYSNVVNNFSIQSNIGPSLTTTSSTLPRALTSVIDGNFAYYVAASDSGNPNTSYRLYKVDLVNNTIIFNVSVESTTTGYTGNVYSLTQDADSVYVVINPKSASDGIVKQIIVINKASGAISYLPLNPDVFANDADIQIIHTYDMPI